jgi:hypothetical protein
MDHHVSFSKNRPTKKCGLVLRSMILIIATKLDTKIFLIMHGLNVQRDHVTILDSQLPPYLESYTDFRNEMG